GYGPSARPPGERSRGGSRGPPSRRSARAPVAPRPACTGRTPSPISPGRPDGSTPPSWSSASRACACRSLPPRRPPLRATAPRLPRPDASTTQSGTTRRADAPELVQRFTGLRWPIPAATPPAAAGDGAALAPSIDEAQASAAPTDGERPASAPGVTPTPPPPP